MTLSQALRNAIFCVFSDTGDIDFDHLSAEDALETMACLFKLLFVAEADEAKSTPEEMSPEDKEVKPYLTRLDIAKMLGIYVHGIDTPSQSAVAAIISHLKLEPQEVDTSDPVQPLYSSSVAHKIGYWLAENEFPGVVTHVHGGSFRVRYEGREGT